VIENIVWTNSWPNIAGACRDFIGACAVKNKRERSMPVRPLGVEQTSRLSSRDPVARSNAGRMVARTTRRSHRPFLG
jgi:hypothetical protein